MMVIYHLAYFIRAWAFWIHNNYCEKSYFNSTEPLDTWDYMYDLNKKSTAPSEERFLNKSWGLW